MPVASFVNPDTMRPRATVLPISVILSSVSPVVWTVPAHFAQIAEYGPAQLARQAVLIRAPYLAQMAQITYLQRAGKPAPGSNSSRANQSRPRVSTTFTRSKIGWFKPWAMANELSKKIQWDERAPFGTGFAREEAERQALTRLFTGCLEHYEQQTKADGLATDDLAVTFGRCITLNTALSSGIRITAREESALRDKMREKFARSQLYWTDADKQSVHETIVIMTMLTQLGYANAERDHNQESQSRFREVARRNVTTLTNASLEQLMNSRSLLGSE
jgi:Family of unknown function (DUF6683)